MPYFLYFLILLIESFLIYIIPYSEYADDFLGPAPKHIPTLKFIAVLYYWGLFIFSCSGYFITRKFIVKKEGFKYSIYVFIGNSIWILLGLIYLIADRMLK